MAKSTIATARIIRANNPAKAAAVAIREARDAIAANRSIYSTSGLASYQNAPFGRGGRWIERPAEAGLRFVGFSDHLNRGIGHSGYYLDPEGDGEVARGCVYQLPARGGRPVYVEAIQLGSEHKGVWREQSTNGAAETAPAVIFLSERHLGELGGRDETGDCDALRSAAGGADSEADHYADKERDYNEAFAEGSKAAEAIQTARESRETARGLLIELRGSRDELPPMIESQTRSEVARLLRCARRQHDKARRLWEEHGTDWRPPNWAAAYSEKHGRNPFPDGNKEHDALAAAFRNGAGTATYWEARRNG